jgi:hypothetical protein
VSAPRAAQGLLELLRQAVLLLGLLASIALALTPAQALVSVRATDWSEERESARRRSWGLAELPADLEAFREQATEGRRADVSGLAWQRLAAQLAAARRGEPTELDRRLETTFSRAELNAAWFRADEPPIADLAGRLSADRSFLHVAVDGGASWIGATWLPPRDARHGAPSWLLYPGRAWARRVLAGALLVYLLLPWPRLVPGAAYYSRAGGVVLPDLIGVVMTGMFFGLPFFVIPATASSPDLFGGDGWWVLTLVGWGMAALGASIFPVAAWYGPLQVVLREDRLERFSLLGRQELGLAEIAAVRPGSSPWPGRVTSLLWLVAIFNPRAAGYALLQGSGEGAVDIVGRGGRVWRLWRQALLGLGPLLARLRELGVPVAPELQEAIASDVSLQEHVARQAARRRRGRLARVLAVLLLLALAIGAELA